MALINCPGCAHKVSDQAVKCPKCGRPIASAVNPAGYNEDGSFCGSVSDFGIKKCVKMESRNFWSGSRLTKSIYTSKTHGVPVSMRINKTKAQIIKIWALGLFGTLGLHYFFAGRILTGSLRFLYGALLLVIGLIVAFAPREVQEFHPFRIMLVFLFFMFIPSVWDIIIILLGRFRDVFRSYIKSNI